MLFLKSFKMEKPRTLLLFLLIFSVGVISRLLIGLQSPHALAFDEDGLNSDLGIIGLMAKYVLERGEFPFFFWGQDWFGGLEAFLHAMAFWIFGITPWAMRLAPLFLFALFCVLSFLIARDLFNDEVALLALLWCAFAPMIITILSIHPHTHYIETPVLGSLLLWLTIRLTKASSVFRKKFLYLVLGFFSGLSWWVTPIIVYYLVGIAFFLLFKERKEAIRYGLLISIPSFFIGALPFFIYYIRDPFSDIFSLGQGFRLSHIPDGLLKMYDTTLNVLDHFRYREIGKWARPALVVFYLFVLVVYIIKAEGKNFIRLFSKASMPGAKGLLTFFLLSVTLIYSSSMFGQRGVIPRYLIVLTSFFPIACAYAVWQVPIKLRLLTIPIYGAFLFAQGYFIWSWGTKEVPLLENRVKPVYELIDFLKSKGLTRVYASYGIGAYAMTFIANEEIIFTTARYDRRRPYEFLLDTAERVGMVSDKLLHFDEIFKMIGGSYKENKVGHYILHYDFKEPDGRYHQINIKNILIQSSHDPEKITSILDRNMKSTWSTLEPKAKNAWIQMDLGKTYPIGMIRLWNRGQDHGSYALKISVEGSLDGEKWSEILDPTQGDYYYWSGPRLYPWEWGYRFELRFKGVKARYIRIRQWEDKKAEPFPWKINELYIYEYSQGASLGDEGEEEILREISDLKLERIYSDRWMNAKIRDAFKGNIEIVDLFSAGSPRRYKRLKSRVVQWGPKVGFVLEYSDADNFSEMMKEEGINLSRKDFKRWSLFYFEAWGEYENLFLERNQGWWWMGLGVVKTGEKKTSDFLRVAGDLKASQNDDHEALRFYKSALIQYSNNQNARRGLVRALNKLDQKDEASEQVEILKIQTESQYHSPILFSKGVEFLGYRISSETAKPGQALEVIYYWKLNEDPGRGMGVMVHVEGQGRLIQGDHRFLNRHMGVWPALENEIFSQKEYLRIPTDVLPGDYEIGLGLYDLKSGKRWKLVRTELPNKEQKVIIGKLQIS